jgi:hypothetical protein
MADWMRGPATRAFDAKDLEAIAASFEQMTKWAPSGYANWASICGDGAQAARVGNLEAVKAACRGCHTQYEERYKTELGTRPLP